MPSRPPDRPKPSEILERISTASGQELPPPAEDAVYGVVTRIFEAISYACGEKRPSSFDEIREQVRRIVPLGTENIGIDLEDGLSLIESFGPESLEDLRSRIQELTTQIVFHVGRARAEEELREFEAFAVEHGFTAADMLRSNPYGMAIHRAERAEGPRCTVYEYRRLDGDFDVDVWEYRSSRGQFLYLEKRLSR